MNQQVTPEQFSKLLSAVQLFDLLLLKSNAERAPLPTASGTLDASYEFEATASTDVQKDGQKLLLCQLGFSFFGKSTDKIVIKVRAHYNIIYTLDAGYVDDPAALKYFAENNALFNIWPFFREHLHSIVGKMGLPHFVLPLLKPSMVVKPSKVIDDPEATTKRKGSKASKR